MTSCVSNQRASQALRTRICRNANDFRAFTEARFGQGNYLRELFLALQGPSELARRQFAHADGKVVEHVYDKLGWRTAMHDWTGTGTYECSWITRLSPPAHQRFKHALHAGGQPCPVVGITRLSDHFGLRGIGVNRFGQRAEPRA